MVRRADAAAVLVAAKLPSASANGRLERRQRKKTFMFI